MSDPHRAPAPHGHGAQSAHPDAPFVCVCAAGSTDTSGIALKSLFCANATTEPAEVSPLHVPPVPPAPILAESAESTPPAHMMPPWLSTLQGMPGCARGASPQSVPNGAMPSLGTAISHNAPVFSPVCLPAKEAERSAGSEKRKSKRVRISVVVSACQA